MCKDKECPEFREVKGKIEKLDKAHKELESHIGKGEKPPLAKEKIFTIQLLKPQPR